MAYHLEYVDTPGKFDEAVEQDGVKVLIDSKALFSIIGSEMDWVEDRLRSASIRCSLPFVLQRSCTHIALSLHFEILTSKTLVAVGNPSTSPDGLCDIDLPLMLHHHVQFLHIATLAPSIVRLIKYPSTNFRFRVAFMSLMLFQLSGNSSQYALRSRCTIRRLAKEIEEGATCSPGMQVAERRRDRSIIGSVNKRSMFDHQRSYFHRRSPSKGKGVALTLTKPMAADFSRKHCRQRSRPYFRMRPA